MWGTSVMSTDAQVEERLRKISEKGQFAMLVDILTPKPGNVHRFRDHPDTRFVHFAASIVQLGYPLYEAARWGYQQSRDDDKLSKLGELMKTAVQASMEPHGKNTLLGTILLLIPLAAAAGYEISRAHTSLMTLHQSLARILQNTSVEDAVELIRALQIANPGGSIPKTPEWTLNSQAFDFQSPRTIELVRREKYSLVDLQALAATYDSIAKEYTTDFAYIFDVLYPQLIQALNQHPRVEDAVLATYLWALSQRPDSFILRKAGSKMAKQVMNRAKKIYTRIIKVSETQWLDKIASFDDYLRAEGSKLNPGTTADLLTSALYLALLLGNIKFIL